ncbi:hypothetical protein Q3G72_017747 [Acer saccharum]|nr:hypothetical protein Q3G72_017747 [Acer saccharum]
MQSRKRGGDRDKKKKRKRKRAGKRKGRGETKKNKNLKVVRLVSSAGTGFSYAKKKNTKKKEKLEIKKYDPQMKRHVKFMELWSLQERKLHSRIFHESCQLIKCILTSDFHLSEGIVGLSN